MNPQTKTQRVVVTAGGSGIGLAIARRFQAGGARVHVCDIAAAAIDQARELGLSGSVTDVGDANSVGNYFSTVYDEIGGVDVLVNNAGVGGPKAAIEDISIADWDQVMRVNLSGMFYCIREVTPGMKEQGHGCIVNISTANAKIGLPMRLPYVASKAGVLGLTYNVARELGPFGIRCNAILPGPVDNPRGRALVDAQAESRNVDVATAEHDFLKYSSMRSWIDPAEVGDAAVYLASNAGRHISGQSIGVCGNLEWEE